MLKENSFKFDVITPIIMRGAEKQEEFRIPSIKGVMRFWFRALMGCFIYDIGKLYEVESKVFGSTNEKSNIIIKINQFDKRNFQDMTYIDYRYFLFPFRENEHRVKWIKDGVNFSLTCSFNDIDPNIIDSTFKLISLFGGIGARTRRGFGSICLSDYNIIDENDFIIKFKDIIKFYKDYSNSKSINYSLRKYSSFVCGEIIFLDNEKYKWKKFISEIYNELSTDLKNPKDYENLFLKELKGFNNLNGLHEAIKFIELTLHYFRYINKRDMDKINLGLPIGTSGFRYNHASERRASPIFFKILKLKSGKYLPIVFYLNSEDLLANEKLKIQIIKKYFNFLNDKYNNKKSFYNILLEA